MGFDPAPIVRVFKDTIVRAAYAQQRDTIVPRNGKFLVVFVVARISGGPRQKEMSLEDQVDHAKEIVAEMYGGPVETFDVRHAPLKIPAGRAISIAARLGQAAGNHPAARLPPRWHGWFQGLFAPAEEMVPLKEPVDVPIKVSYERSLVKLPLAPSNRPVPPVMVAVSVMDMTPSVAVGMDWPVKSADSVSPLAAVK